ncbi:protease modulator HflC [Temperatibacter marinus]|uniref:Protein HflC n=1 Tax=Temperatibacter marinus TaxID=1456591 RepID=A0AA52ECE2_9PROT|nr:protease modulator HflC [Temperatibacter marinus]WND02822.1 protease modulator HflC [Temperatibacter marinus]
MKTKSIISLILLVVLLFVGSASLFVVNETQQAIVLRLGQMNRLEMNAGLHFKLPFVEEVVRLERRMLNLDAAETEVVAADQNRLIVDSFARFKIVDPLKAYQTARSDQGRSALLERILMSSLQKVIAENTMPDIVTNKRAEIMDRIAVVTNENAKEVGLEIIDVRLKQVEVPTNNREKIFQQMKTERERIAREQRALGQSEAVTIRANADREAAVIRADARRTASITRGEADAYAVRVFAEAFGKDEDFFEFYRTMQTYKKALGKSDTTLVLSPDSEFFKLLMSGGKVKK